jgi:amidase
MQELTFQSACELAKAIKNRVLTSVQLLESYKERIERFNPEINAIVSTNFDSAMKKARAADKALDEGEIKGPLHGIPITIKDNLEVTGFPCTAGASEFENYHPTKNADLVNPLLKAGAIVIGKSNLPRFAEDFQTYNGIFGQTNNPWDATRTPGGSSGGAAAAVAAGLTTLDIGNDLGGSIRLPAHFCGVYGHKPSFGIVPWRGLVPPTPGVFSDDYLPNMDIAVNGPIARSPEDLAMVLDLIVRPGKTERKAWSIKLPPPRRKKLKEFKVGFWLDDPACPVGESVITRIRRVADALSNTGVRIEEKHPKINFDRSFDLFTSLLGSIRGQSAPREIFNKWLETPSAESDLPENFQSRQISGATQRHRDWLNRDAERQIIRQKWGEFFKEFDVMLCPVAPVTAFPHDHSSWFKREIEINGEVYPYSNIMGWTGLTGLAYLPSVTAPIGISSKGLPIGVQIVGPFLEDKTAIQFAVLLKDLVGGFTPPPLCL